MDKIIEAIENMVSVEEAAHHCPKCAPGAFCVKHDEAFWSFWGQVKRLLTSRSSRAADGCGCKSATRIQCAFWDGEGGCIHPPPV